MEQNTTKKPKLKVWHYVFIACGIFAIIGQFLPEKKATASVEKVLTQQEQDSISLKKATDVGKRAALRNLKALVQKDLNDPKSFDVLDDRMFSVDSIIIVVIEYTAKNQFGGVIKKSIKAEADINGNITKVFN